MDYIDDLVATVVKYHVRLARTPDTDAARRPAPGQWSAKEIVGHLIDSASNNHQRFVRARWQDDLVFAGYEQDGWVEAQRYRDAPWPALLDLWSAYNLHLARVMGLVPDEIRLREHLRHNLDQLAFRPVPAGVPATLDDFMRDYVAHVHHHLRQIDALTASGSGASDDAPRASEASRTTSEFPGPVPEIPVRDIAAAAAYYQDTLGFSLDWGGEALGLAGISKGHCRMFLANQQYRQNYGNTGPTLNWLNLGSMEEVDALYRIWSASHATVISAPESKPWGLHEFTAADLDGNLLRVFYDFATPERAGR